ncbi:DUF2249 domain-containing protein [Pseudonocardia dioxanivorans]|uniref:DUF2249 domain-containing protein n=1 Tax=Pseudonocardia dioxanivorans TaxID=240495 RepID=UPI000CD25123|nr:DUF2249 domain-containing protein [Pseudonocardia dioxanivorans]
MSSATDIHILGTEDDPARRAQTLLLDRDAEMLADLAAKVELATGFGLPLARREEAQDSLVEFCSSRLRRHMEATDRVLYAVAAGAEETRLLARSLRLQHEMIRSRVARLGRADTADELNEAAHAGLTLLRCCAEIERLLLLPALAELPGVDLADLAEDVVTLLTWGHLEIPEVLDVREIPHGRRHPRIFDIYARLAPGESFVLVNNHDPKPLHRQFQATYPDQFDWTYLESGPARWRVRITRTLPEA